MRETSQLSELAVQQARDTGDTRQAIVAAVDIDAVDRQHKGLFQAMNHFYQACQDERHESAIQQRLDELVKSAKQHLQDEEQLMQKANYSQLSGHKQVHVKLLTDLDKLPSRFKATEPGLNMEITMFLKNWLIDHIFRVDKQDVSELHTAGIH